MMPPDQEPRTPNELLLPEGPFGELAMAQSLARYALAAGAAAQTSVLDVGCGIGHGSQLLADAGAREVLGIDVSRHAIEEARRRARSESPIRFEHEDLLAAELPDASFGLVVCFDLLDDLADIERACGVLARVLQPEGVLFTSTDSPATVQLISDRFEHTREMNQWTEIATVIYEQGHDGGEPHEIGGRVLGSAQPAADTAATRLLVASERSLEDVAPLTMHTGPLRTAEWLRAGASWEERARRAEAELAAAQIELGYLTEAMRDLTSRRKRKILKRRFSEPGDAG